MSRQQTLVAHGAGAYSLMHPPYGPCGPSLLGERESRMHQELVQEHVQETGQEQGIPLWLHQPHIASCIAGKEGHGDSGDYGSGTDRPV